ncbi:MAG: ABC transporter ATP-binding protein [Bacteroidetes bacterium]|nr:ABC transporter ATP-binding protein [Bacteroidota bacterium]
MSRKTTSKKIFDTHTLRRILSFAKPYRRTLYFALSLSLFLAVLTPLRPYLIQLSVDKYIQHNLLVGLIWISVFHFGILLLESLLRFWFLYRINWLGQTVVNDLRKTVFEKIIFQNISYFDKTAIGTLTTRTINDIEAVNDVFSEGIISILADVLTIIAIIIVMFVTDWRLTCICLTTFPFLIIATYYFKESVNKSFQRVRNAVSALNAFVQEHLSGMYLVQAFAVEKRELEAFKTINHEHREANIKAIFAYSVFFPVVEIILAMSLGLLVWWGANQMLNHQVTAGIVIAFVMYLNLLFRPLRMLADKFNVLQMGMVAGERVFGVLDHSNWLENKGKYRPTSLRGEVTFQNVHFQYIESIPVLRGISFQVPAGHTLAIVGHSGAGKTSIISILNRLYEIQSGQILIDNHDINQYDVDNLRSHIGIVLQDVFLFSGTVRDNITLRNNHISQQRIEEVTKMLGLHEFILSLPQGYDFNVMERGNSLSQGQRQLLSFARALLYDPAILILDEATASVDSESEQLIQQAINTLIQGRTAIIIAHRLSTIRKADEIIVLEKGNIMEQGNHTTLMSKKGKYFSLYNAVKQTEDENAI